ncbi:hypothetical protein ACBQ19_08440, partial [Hafnia alvei]
DPAYQEFSVKIPKQEREKIGLFYDYAVDGEYLKNSHLDAYSQKLERKFENKVTVGGGDINRIFVNAAAGLLGRRCRANLL